jgi:hypothetical protein
MNCCAPPMPTAEAAASTIAHIEYTARTRIRRTTRISRPVLAGFPEITVE